MSATKKPREKYKDKLPQTLVGDLRTLKDSGGWRFVTKKLDDAAKAIKSLLWTPCTDQSLKYNADHLLKERLAAIWLLMNLPDDNIELFEQVMSTNQENRKPLHERLAEKDKKFAEELAEYITQ